MSIDKKQYYDPVDSPLWLTSHRRRPEFSSEYLAYWFARYGFILLICFFVALVFSAIAFLPELRRGNAMQASLDSLREESNVPASPIREEIDSTTGLPPDTETLLLNVSSEPEGQVVFIDFDSVGVTPLYRQRLVPGVYVVSVGDDFVNRKDTVLVANNTDSRWLYFGADQKVSGRSESPRSDEAPIRTEIAVAATENTVETVPEPVETPPEPRREEARSVSSDQPARSGASATPPPSSSGESETETPSDRGSGTLTFQSNPAGAIVLLDGVLVGSTPLTLKGVPVGEHAVIIKKDRYDDYEATIEVERSESFVVETTLASRVGQVVVLVEPWGSIYIDGKLYKLETDIEYSTELAAGRHIITATHPRLGSVSKEVDLAGGDRMRITLSFDQ